MRNIQPLSDQFESVSSGDTRSGTRHAEPNRISVARPPQGAYTRRTHPDLFFTYLVLFLEAGLPSCLRGMQGHPQMKVCTRVHAICFLVSNLALFSSRVCPSPSSQPREWWSPVCFCSDRNRQTQFNSSGPTHSPQQNTIYSTPDLPPTLFDLHRPFHRLPA